MREVGAGDSQSQLDLLNEIIGDLSEFDKKIFSDNFFSSVKNWMLVGVILRRKSRNF